MIVLAVTVSGVAPADAAVIVVEPKAFAVTSPFDPALLPTEAMSVSAEVQVADAVISWLVPSEKPPVATNCSVEPSPTVGFAGVTDITPWLSEILTRLVSRHAQTGLRFVSFLYRIAYADTPAQHYHHPNQQVTTLARRMLVIKQRTRSSKSSTGAVMLPITAMIYGFCLGAFFFTRSQYLAGLLVFLTVSVGGVIVGCYLETLARELLKELFVRTRVLLPTLFRTHKPEPATATSINRS